MQNAFFEQLQQYGQEFDVSQKMVVNLLRKFELSIWKLLLTHLLRVLNAASCRPGVLADMLNTRCAWPLILERMRSFWKNRFCQVPMFGQFTIWSFHNNVSEMKRLAARDFEDILQVYFNFILLIIFF